MPNSRQVEVTGYGIEIIRAECGAARLAGGGLPRVPPRGGAMLTLLRPPC